VMVMARAWGWVQARGLRQVVRPGPLRCRRNQRARARSPARIRSEIVGATGAPT
jgi:hypothetical protein